mgnify:CR=1 FL=1
MKNTLFALLFLVLIVSSCTKNENIIVKDNDIFDPRSVPTVQVENYVNKIFIDLLGREPLDEEMVKEVQVLRDSNLSYVAREFLITKLMTDETYVEGDSSYRTAYYRRIYETVKAKLCEGAADGEFTRYVGLAGFAIKVGRLEGDSIRVYGGLEQQRRNQTVVDSRKQYERDSIDLQEMFARLLDNNVYDVINMNTFNFVNASFDDLLGRFPIQAEFDVAYDIIQNNSSGSLFGGSASNKREYCLMLVNSMEFSESAIRWAYQSLLGRQPSTQEVHNLVLDFHGSRDFQQVQLTIMRTNEYANFN